MFVDNVKSKFLLFMGIMHYAKQLSNDSENIVHGS